jgi:hypothetical protein
MCDPTAEAYVCRHQPVEPGTDRTRQVEMSRYERRQFFEALCMMREGYTNRSDDDRRSALSVGDAIIYADAVMTALEADNDLLVEDEAATVTESSVADAHD